MSSCIRTVRMPSGQEVICGFPVSGGGNQHALNHCPPRGRQGEHYRNKTRRKHRQENLPQRGIAVGGIIKGGKHKKAGAKK